MPAPLTSLLSLLTGCSKKEITDTEFTGIWRGKASASNSTETRSVLQFLADHTFSVSNLPRRYIWTVTLLSLLMLFGCVPLPQRFAKSDVLGTYEIHYPFGTETLVLDEETYQQRFADKTGKVFTANGKWTFDSTARQNQGALENAMSVCDGFGNFASTTPQQGRHLITFAWHGGTVIPINDDKDFYMRKVK